MAENTPPPAANAAELQYRRVPVQDITASPHQARKQFDEEGLGVLAESMRQEGLLQPITVRLTRQSLSPISGTDPSVSPGPNYQLVAGERRLRAAKLLGWLEIDARVVETVSEGEMAAKGLLENLQRQDLNAIEEAEGFQSLLDLKDGHWTQEQIGKLAGRTQAYISRSVALLKLPEPILENIRRRILSRDHGLELMRIDNTNQQKAIAQKAVKAGLSTRALREVIDRKLGIKNLAEALTSPSELEPELKLENLLTQAAKEGFRSDLPGSVDPENRMPVEPGESAGSSVSTDSEALDPLAAFWPPLVAEVRYSARGWDILLPASTSSLAQSVEATRREVAQMLATLAKTMAAGQLPLEGTRIAVPVPQIREVQYVSGNRLRLAWESLGEGYTYRIFEGDASEMSMMAGDEPALVVCAATVNVYPTAALRPYSLSKQPIRKGTKVSYQPPFTLCLNPLTGAIP